MMHGHEKSDPSIVAMKPANKGGQPPAESVEPRGGAEGNAIEHRHAPDTEPGKHVPRAGSCTAQQRRTEKEERFTALLHHVDVDLLRSAYRLAAAGGGGGCGWGDVGGSTGGPGAQA